ncbi:methyltransferase domain-containing protein [Campylobacter upsaliensis]|nr:methyltransferase domain-containing protein [Campylobacter upsaliensis]
MHKKIIAVVGYANLERLKDKDRKIIQNLALDLGKKLIQEGYIIVNGGLGGVMEAVSSGAREADNYMGGQTLGLVPNYNKNIANPYIDIVLPLGLDVARNVCVASVCDAMVVIGGESGSLSEMALAWQFGKLIIALSNYGYGGIFKNKPLDSRRKDKIYFANNANEVVEILKEKLPLYQKTFAGISKDMTRQEAKDVIKKHCDILVELEFLGQGSEGFIFTDKNKVYKLFKHSSYLSRLYFQLEPLSWKLKGTHFILHFEIYYKDDVLIVSYQYFKTKPFEPMPYKAYIDLLSNFYYAGIVCCDMQPKNLLIDTRHNSFVICDIGWDFISYSNELFESMCRRAFAIYKLQNHLHKIDRIKEFLSPLNTQNNFEALEKFLQCENLLSEYQKFVSKIGAFASHKTLIRNFYMENPQYQNIFDYGAGNGEISSMLSEIGKNVIGYEISDDVIKDKYRAVFKRIIIGNEELENFIKTNQQFDSVLCSLVLCHHLADTQEEALKIIDSIMSNLVRLSKKHIFIAICNPLFFKAKSNIQKRENHTSYNTPHTVTKMMFSTKRNRLDYHRPLGFYEALFAKYGLIVQDIFQSGDFRANHYKISNSDFIFFSLIKE